MLSSHPDYKTYNELWNLYCIAKNPQLWVNEFDLEDWQHKELLAKLESLMQDVLDGLPVIFLEELRKIENRLNDNH